VIYISHEWVGRDHPDPDGTQMYHLLLLLERLRTQEVPRVELDAVIRMYYPKNTTMTTKQWCDLLSSEKTYIWYDGFCVPRSKREDGFFSIPAYVARSQFSIALVPGCTHFDRIDPRTQRKMNLCYRTYRGRAQCVLEMIVACLSRTESSKPVLLVRSGTFFFLEVAQTLFTDHDIYTYDNRY